MRVHGVLQGPASTTHVDTITATLVPDQLIDQVPGEITVQGSATVTFTALLTAGDICRADLGSQAATLLLQPDFDGQGNGVYAIERDEKYGLVFRLESGDGENVNLRID